MDKYEYFWLCNVRQFDSNLKYTLMREQNQIEWDKLTLCLYTPVGDDLDRVPCGLLHGYNLPPDALPELLGHCGDVEQYREIETVIESGLAHGKLSGECLGYTWHCVPDELPDPEKLSQVFTRILTDWLGVEKLAQVVALNGTPEYSGCCASHDFCDSNQAIIDAWNELSAVEIDSGSTEHAYLLNKAWDMAKANSFGLVAVKTPQANQNPS